jgi:superfamily II DNA or RNA helicase
MGYSYWPHQEDANRACEAFLADSDQHSGRVVIPTGGGKTGVEAWAMAVYTRDYIANASAATKMAVNIVVSPRCALTEQLFDEYPKSIHDYDFKQSRQIAFHSGNAGNPNRAYSAPWLMRNYGVVSTTTKSALGENYEKAVASGNTLDVYTTYHSYGKLVGFLGDLGIPIGLAIFDESQYAVSENFGNAVQLDGPVKRLFFTATEVHGKTQKSRGHNNIDLFGRRLYSISPRELIDLGFIVEPRISILTALLDSDEGNVVREVIEAAVQHFNSTTSDGEKSLPFRKVLYAMDGTDSIGKVFNAIEEIKNEVEERTGRRPEILTIASSDGSSEHKIPAIDGKKISRADWMDALNVEKDCLAFHYDIISEGIDVEGFTGIHFMRLPSQSKALQMIGRVIRTYKSDLALKTFGRVTVARINGENETAADITNFVEMLVGHGFDKDAVLSDIRTLEDSAKGSSNEEDNPFPEIGDASKLVDDVSETYVKADWADHEYKVREYVETMEEDTI